MATAKFCPDCGAALPPDSPQGICPRCAFNVALGYPGREGEATLSNAYGSAGRFQPPKPEDLAQYFPQLEILDLIGQGGMGAVYKVRQKGLDRIVALKILPPQVAADASFGERFRREARALARLNHPHIVSVYDSGEAGGLYYFLMEYVDGVNIRQAIQSAAIEPKAALAIVPQICDALQYAHDEGVVHRDIKPENILLDAKGRVKIADFGLARLLGKTGDTYTITGTHQVMGTPRYMAPEQLEGTHEVDHRADIYSLGVVFYEMLTRELPIGRFAPPSRKVQLDVRLDEVVLRTLEKEPSHRYQHASELKTAVETITGVPHIPPHLQRVYGYEYRSKLTIFGYPFLHIATGIDPVTHRRRIAKGFIAMGDQAIGVFALGGAAFGGVTLGGLSIGLFSIGGMSIGLLFALGGAAIGMGLAIGGFAMAPIAMGGCAVGMYAMGGSAFGLHALGGNARDAIARDFFAGWAQPAIQLMTICSVAIPLFIFASWLLATVMGPSQNNDQPTPEPKKPGFPPQDRQPAQHSAALLAGCVVLMVAMVLCGIPLVGAGSWFLYRSRSIVRKQEQVAVEAEISAQENAAKVNADFRAHPTGIDWTPAGPRLDDAAYLRTSLVPAERAKVDAVLQEMFQQYLQLEAKHRGEPNVDGFTVISIPSAALDQLENQLWTKLDAELPTIEKQSLLRSNLSFTPPERAHLQVGTSVDDILAPGLFGWGAGETKIKVGRRGSWYTWTIQSQGFEHSGSSPEVPRQFQRFWMTPEKQ